MPTSTKTTKVTAEQKTIQKLETQFQEALTVQRQLVTQKQFLEDALTLQERSRKEIINQFIDFTQELIGNLDLPRKISILWILMNINTAVKFINGIIQLIKDLRNTPTPPTQLPLSNLNPANV